MQVERVAIIPLDIAPATWIFAVDLDNFPCQIGIQRHDVGRISLSNREYRAEATRSLGRLCVRMECCCRGVELTKFADGGNPLAHVATQASEDGSVRLAAFGGAFQPGLYRPQPEVRQPDGINRIPADIARQRKIANPAPLGLAGFALTTFLLSMINLGARGLATPNIVVGPSFAYGGLCQLLSGMWEIAVGNTFGGTALSSYGGFWISIGIILTPGGFAIEDAYSSSGDFYAAFGLYLIGWFIITFLVSGSWGMSH